MPILEEIDKYISNKFPESLKQYDLDSNNSKENNQSVFFLGIKRAGKSSLVEVLRKKESEDIHGNPQPTIALDYSYQGYQSVSGAERILGLFEYGGQFDETGVEALKMVKSMIGDISLIVVVLNLEDPIGSLTSLVSIGEFLTKESITRNTLVVANKLDLFCEKFEIEKRKRFFLCVDFLVRKFSLNFVCTCIEDKRSVSLFKNLIRFLVFPDSSTFQIPPSVTSSSSSLEKLFVLNGISTQVALADLSVYRPAGVSQCLSLVRELFGEYQSIQGEGSNEKILENLENFKEEKIDEILYQERKIRKNFDA